MHTELHLMQFWKEKIKELPKYIQDMIYEFNVDHRKNMRHCFREFYGFILNNCLNCSVPFPREYFWSVDYFVNRKYKLNCYWCSQNCFNTTDRIEIKLKYLKSLLEYLEQDSIQYHEIIMISSWIDSIYD